MTTTINATHNLSVAISAHTDYDASNPTHTTRVVLWLYSTDYAGEDRTVMEGVGLTREQAVELARGLLNAAAES